MRPVVNADREPVDELAAEPTGEQREAAGDEGQREGHTRRSHRRVATQQPAGGEEHDDEEIAAAVECADPPGSGAGRNGQPVDEPEGRGEQPGDHAGRDHPVGDPLVEPEGEQIEDDCHRQQTGRKTISIW
jgi:hypothetical protein